MEKFSLSFLSFFLSFLCHSTYNNWLIQNCPWSCRVRERIDIISVIKKMLELLVLRKRGFQSRVGDGDGCRIGFLPLKSSAVEQNSQIPKDLLVEFDPAPKLCSRSTTGKRAFQLKKRVSECAEFTIESLCFAAREKAWIAILSCRTMEREIYLWRLRGAQMPRRDARIMRRIRIDTLSVSSLNARRILRKRYLLTKLSSFYILSRTAYVSQEHRKKDLCHNREKRIIRLQKDEVTIVGRRERDGRRYVSIAVSEENVDRL